AENITECSYLYDATTLTEPAQFIFSVKAVTPKGSSGSTTAPAIIAGPASPIPFTETFNINDREADKLWSFYCPDYAYMSGSVTEYIYAGGTQTYAVGGVGGMFCVGFYSSHSGYKAYYTSAKINVEDQEALTLSFQLLHILKSTGAADAQIAFDGGEFTSVVRGDMTGCESTEWVKYSDNVDVPAGAKTAILRFVLEAGTSPDYLAIDEISLRAAGAPVTPYPASASDLAAVYDFEANHVKVTFKAPTLSHHSLGEVNDEPLEYITKIDLFRQIGYGDYTLVKTFDETTEPKAAPGAEFEYIDTDLTTGGEYYYKVVVYVDDNCDFGQFLDKPVKVGQRPAEISDLTATSNKGSAPVVLKFTAPTLDEDGNDLRAINSIVISRKLNSEYSYSSSNIIGVLTDVTPGDECEFIDNDVQDNYYYDYKAVVTGTGGDNYGRQTSIFVGIDQPNVPTDVTATANDDNTVTVSWTAPTTGINNGYIDVENLTYIVLLGSPASDYDAVELERDIKTTTYTYKAEPGDERAVRFFVKAVNDNREGYAGISNTLVIGDPAKLPYQE
ncbi:MAG: fibronectin type III domain-containing protein, partial [Muribaculaceae bacterium]|nr:fibronectin type III domain-containing protein [Muribaculaceae bacterium]